MKKILAIFLMLLLAGCINIVKVEGDQVINNKLAVKLPHAWNKLPAFSQPYETWTLDGMGLDELRFWAGFKPGQALMTIPPGTVPLGQKAPRVPTYTAGMQPDQLVSLFETLYSADGSTVKIQRIDAVPFAGEKGLRFEFSVTRKTDDLLLSGVGWVAVREGDLYAATFVAPQLSFFRRLYPKAESIIATARIKA